MPVPSPFVRLVSVMALLPLVLVHTPARAQTCEQGDPGRSLQWGLSRVGASEGWAAGTGDGTVIAIVDTGVDLLHEDLVDQLVAGHDFVDDDADPRDENGHGTHVAGIAGASTDNCRGVSGIAPGVRLMPVRVLDENGDGFSDDVRAGVEWAVDNGADVVNLSLGVEGAQLFGTALDAAVNYAWDNGVIPVVAAGNDYVLGSGFADEPALVVAATTRDDTKPTYSNGVGSAKWGLAAPGGSSSQAVPADEEEDVLSTWWNRDEPGEHDVYAYDSGTSMAAPHVAGAAAILRSLGLSPQETVDRLLATARDIGPRGDDSTFGHGLLDVAAATEGFARTPPTTAAPPPGPTTTAPMRTPVESTGSGRTAGSPTTSTPPATTPGTPTVRDPRPVDDGRFSEGALGRDEGDAGVPLALALLAASLVVASGGAHAALARRRGWALPRVPGRSSG